MSEFDSYLEPMTKDGNVITSFSVTFTEEVAHAIGIVDFEGTAMDLASVIAVLRDEVAANINQTDLV